MVRNLRVELLKLRKRWLTWIVLLILVSSAIILPGMLLAILKMGDRLPGAQPMPPAIAAQLEQALLLPNGVGSLLSLIGGSNGIGMLLFVILAGVSVGNEYTWKTVRAALVRGRSRWDFLLTKLVAILLLVGVSFLLTMAVGLPYLGLLTVASRGRLDLSFLTASFVGEVLLGVLRTGYALVPYILLAMLLSVIGRSPWIGVGVTLAYALLVEGMALQLLAMVGRPWSQLYRFSLGGNVAGLMAANPGGQALAGGGLEGMDALLNLPSANQAALVLALYSLLFLVGMLVAFRRQEITP